MDKQFYLSKTYWVNLILAALAFYPPVTSLISANPEIVTAVFAGLNLILRTITKKEVKFLP